MTKDVLVSISGLQRDILEKEDQEDEPIEVVTPASYYCKNGKHYIIYDEVIEGFPGTTRNKIKISGTDSLEIMKTGASNSHMIFEKNKQNLSYYKTPYSQLMVGVRTKNMKVDVKPDSIGISVDYALDLDHKPYADCHIRMNIVEKSGAESLLQ